MAKLTSWDDFDFGRINDEVYVQNAIDFLVEDNEPILESSVIEENVNRTMSSIFTLSSIVGFGLDDTRPQDYLYRLRRNRVC